MTFFIWTLPDWNAYQAGRSPNPHIVTRCQHFAAQEYGCGLIVTMLDRGRHIPIKPVTVH